MNVKVHNQIQYGYTIYQKTILRVQTDPEWEYSLQIYECIMKDI